MLHHLTGQGHELISATVCLGHFLANTNSSIMDLVRSVRLPRKPTSECGMEGLLTRKLLIAVLFDCFEWPASEYLPTNLYPYDLHFVETGPIPAPTPQRSLVFDLMGALVTNCVRRVGG